MQRWIRATVLALALSGALIGVCPERTAGAEERSAVQPKEQTIKVIARNYYFEPAVIEVEKGTRVTIQLVNQGTERHEWELDAYGVEIKPIAPGTTGRVTFVADKEGIFEYACHVDQHYEKGMRGFLKVR